MKQAVQNDVRFAFGENWRRFLQDITPERITIAEQSLRDGLGLDDLRGGTFLDVGCGSGLFSLAATRLHADHVHSFDHDERSVAATALVKERFAPDTDWQIERGDATSDSYMAALGQFDIVYSWGVLHHTGAMWNAIDLTAQRVAPGGLLFISIYNDQGAWSKWWLAVKRNYNRIPQKLQAPYAVAVRFPWEVHMVVKATLRGQPLSYVREWTQTRSRGMSRWHDLLDWAGGYPFEVAKPEEVFSFCRDRGFELSYLTTNGGGSGCNQFVFFRGSHDRPKARR